MSRVENCTSLIRKKSRIFKEENYVTQRRFQEQCLAAQRLDDLADQYARVPDDVKRRLIAAVEDNAEDYVVVARTLGPKPIDGMVCSSSASSWP